MRFQEAQKRGEQPAIAGALAQVVRPDPGQVQEPARAPFVGQRGGKGLQRQRFGLVCGRALHRLTFRSESGRGGKLAKILIVEDNALNIKLFCDLLAAHGHQPRAVTDSREAFEAARSFAPDLVITDIQLPHVSGMELIRLLRADAELGKVPIMAVTAYAGAGDEERIRAAGAQAYVSKPISVGRFVAEVDALLAPEPQLRTEV
jgi:two-component system, cell cycle response regulator DivK